MRRKIFGMTAWVVAACALNACQTPSPQPPAPGTPIPDPVITQSTKPVITPEAARNLAHNCFACHGPDGRSPGSIPSLSTLSANEIANQLKRFRQGESFSTVMERQAKGYSDAEIEALANYIGQRNKGAR